MIYFCSQQNRRALVLQHPTLNGIDFLEVCESGADCGCGRKLLVTMLKDVRSLVITPAQITINGGSAAGKAKAPIQILSVAPGTAQGPKVVTVMLDEPGDFSTFTFSLVATASTTDPPDGIDPQLASVEFSFKAGCATVGDCVPDNCCPPPVRTRPDINYMAKDYDAFVQVMTDRLAVLAPGALESHPSDIGVAIVELLAYAADRLSYQQDAVGTESYLGTARSRISLRRHARLVDYIVDEGANARTWVRVQPAPTAPNPLKVPSGTMVYPRVVGLAPALGTTSADAQHLALSSALGFATMQDASLFQEQKEMFFYTWSDTNCCLEAEATQATLRGRFSSLAPGTVLIFEEVKGPDTGETIDADPSKRWAVRLTAVQSVDYLNRALVDPLNGEAITRISWSPQDAPPFPICISSVGSDGKPVTDVSVVHGNIIPADHGMPHAWEYLGTVPEAPPAPITTTTCTCGATQTVDAVRARFAPRLSQSPLTFARSFDPTAPASALLAANGMGNPQLSVKDDLGHDWKILDDLLSSDESQTVAVVEVERDGNAFLRFGDGQYGAAPEAGSSFQARYRTGNGTAGNIGRDTLAHIVIDAQIAEVRNPLPAAGGTDAETMEHIRQQAPYGFQSQLRAVTEDDYGVAAALDPAVREARGTLRWTGSWYTAFVSLDAASGDVPSAPLVSTTQNRLDLLRMAGVDLQVEGATIVGLRISMTICVDAAHFQSDVKAAVLKLFTAGDLCSGKAGILNPANFTFGETIYTSPLIAAAQGVEGVLAVTLTAFQRMDDALSDGVAQGYLTMGRLEIARCDNDANRLDHGIFVLTADGGK